MVLCYRSTTKLWRVKEHTILRKGFGKRSAWLVAAKTDNVEVRDKLYGGLNIGINLLFVMDKLLLYREKYGENAWHLGLRTRQIFNVLAKEIRT